MTTVEQRIWEVPWAASQMPHVGVDDDTLVPGRLLRARGRPPRQMVSMQALRNETTTGERAMSRAWSSLSMMRSARRGAEPIGSGPQLRTQVGSRENRLEHAAAAQDDVEHASL